MFLEKYIEANRPKCPECGKVFTNLVFKYCKPCNSAHLLVNFAHWTSGDSNIDELIQNSQLDSNYMFDFVEWIEYSNLENIEFIAQGGFGSVYKAIWKDGPMKEPFWNNNKSEWHRDSKTEVAIKIFENMTSVCPEFLNEVKNYLSFGSICINKIYGLTRNPKNGNYAIVTEFQNGGNLREMIKRNYSILNFKLIFTILNEICNGLNTIHGLNYCHKDFHSGNILNRIYGDNATIVTAISDFGLSCPAEQHSTDKAPYGVLPFVAPEVLRGGEFTKAADIYGFGMLMSEIISGEAPFFDRDYDVYLALDICDGKRPLIPEYAPEQYIALMKRCLDPVPTNRPSTHDLFMEFERWLYDLSVFSQEQEDKWKARLAELATNPRPLKKSQNLLTSKRLDYSKHFSQLLEKKDIEMKTNGDIYQTRQYDMSL